MGELHLEVYVERIKREYKVPFFLNMYYFPFLVDVCQMFTSEYSFWRCYLLRLMLQLESPV